MNSKSIQQVNNLQLNNSITFIDDHFDLDENLDMNKSSISIPTTMSIQSSMDSFTKLLELESQDNLSTFSFFELENNFKLDKIVSTTKRNKRFPNTRTKILYGCFIDLKNKIIQTILQSKSYLTNTTSSLFESSNSIAIKNFRLIDTIMFFKHLYVNRTKGNPNVYIFYSKSIKNI